MGIHMHDALPIQYYNIIYIFITILILLWFMHAFLRFYRVLAFRQSYLTDRIIQIRGLGSYLNYFDSATDTHLHAVVHTRQSKPPVSIPMIYVPVILENVYFSSTRLDFIDLHFDINTNIPGKLLIISRLSLSHLKKAIAHHTKQRFIQSTHRDALSIIKYQLFDLNHQANTIEPKNNKSSSLRITTNHSLRTLCQDEVCDQFAVLIDGIQSNHSNVKVTMKFPSTEPDNNTSDGLYNTRERAYNFAFIFFPNYLDLENYKQLYSLGDRTSFNSGIPSIMESKTNHSKNSPQSNSNRSPSNTRNRGSITASSSPSPWDSFLNLFNSGSSRIIDLSDRNQMNNDIESSDDQEDENLDDRINRESLSSMPRPTDIQVAGASLFYFSGSYLNKDNSSNPVVSSQLPIEEIRKREIFPKEVHLISKEGVLFNSLEIFGVGGNAESSEPEVATANSTSESSSVSPSSPNNQHQYHHNLSKGTKFNQEDCVICLTDPKEIMLLPCRHVCVCQKCLVFVDKCPVCRAFFEEYIFIQNNPVKIHV